MNTIVDAGNFERIVRCDLAVALSVTVAVAFVVALALVLSTVCIG